MNLEKFSDEDRIIFKNNYQNKIFNEIRKNIGKYEWSFKICKLLNLKSRAYVYELKNEGYRLGINQLKLLKQNFRFLDNLAIEKNIEKIIIDRERRSVSGKKGGSISGKRNLIKYPGKLQSQAKKAGLMVLRKYGLDYYRKLSKKYSILGGFASIEKAKPTKQMKRIIRENKNLGLAPNKDFFVNYTIKFSENLRNVDFVYFKNKKIFLVEEVTEIIPYRKQMYPRLLEIIELKKILPKKVKIVFSFKAKRRNYADAIQRIDSGIIFELLKENIIPIIDCEESSRRKIIFDLLKNKSISNYLTDLKNNFQKELEKRLVKQRSLVGSALKMKMNETEEMVHNKLVKLGLNPTGKIIIESKYGTYNEVDNSFELNGNKYFVLVTKTESDYMEVLAGHAKQHVGQVFFIKRLCYPECKILSIILSKRKDIGNSKWVKYLKEYSIVVTSLDEVENALRLSN